MPRAGRTRRGLIEAFAPQGAKEPCRDPAQRLESMLAFGESEFREARQVGWEDGSSLA